jgi:hypothetical protein
MAERDRPAVDIDLLPVEPELATIGQGLGSERLVDFDEVECLDRHLDPVEETPHALESEAGPEHLVQAYTGPPNVARTVITAKVMLRPVAVGRIVVGPSGSIGDG